MRNWWIVAVLAAGCLWWWFRRGGRARNSALPRQRARPQPDAGVPPSEDARMGDYAPTSASVQADPGAGSPVPAAPQIHAIGVTKTEVLRALRADVPHGFRKTQELLIEARRRLKESDAGAGQLQPAALAALRQACHALSAALSEDGWMPADDIARHEAAAIDAFLQRFELAFQNWQSEYALVRRFLPQL